MKNAFFIVLLVLLVSAGCRREDIRSFTIDLPTLTPNQTNQITAALAPYAGVKKETFTWDFDKKQLTLSYDSMQIARTNIRMSIEAAGVSVVYPTNTTGRAGY